MGFFQAEQPKSRKVGVRPTLMMINQAKPFSSLDTDFQCRQHAVCPDRRFHPGPSRVLFAERKLDLGFSGLLSRERHCRWFGFLRWGHFASTFLHSFAPPALPGFLTTTSTLTREQRALRFAVNMNTRRTCSGLPALRDRTFRPLESPSTAGRPGLGLFCSRADRLGLVYPVCRARAASWVSPLASRLTTTTSRDQPSVGARFVILQTGRLPPVALHPLSQGRSYFRLQSSNQTPTGTSTPLIQSAHRRTSPLHDPSTLKVDRQGQRS
jgi:hypothetical protein